MKWLHNSLAILAAAATMKTASAGFTLVRDGPGLTPEEFQEYLTLNTTEGWEPMSRVPHYVVTEDGGVLDLGLGNSTGLVKRGGDRQFNAYTQRGCNNGFLISVRKFGCGVCISGPVAFKSGWLWREKVSGEYPTADWNNAFGCAASRVHHQGILSGQYSSCNNADDYGVSTAASAMLYQGC